MRRALAVSLLTLLTVALAWADKEPWKRKPYQQWTGDDLQQIFHQSPWSYVVLIDGTWVPYAIKEQPRQPVSGSSRAMPTSAATTAEAARGTQARFLVFWASSRIMRCALARQEVLESGRSEADAYKNAEQPLPDYWIAISGDDMTPFQKNDEALFRAHAWLQLKKTKQKISPNKVTYQKGPDGKAIAIAVFYFSNKTSTGDSLISPDEKNAQFSCPIGGSALQPTFETQEIGQRARARPLDLSQVLRAFLKFGSAIHRDDRAGERQGFRPGLLPSGP